MLNISELMRSSGSTIVIAVAVSVFVFVVKIINIYEDIAFFKVYNETG